MAKLTRPHPIPTDSSSANRFICSHSKSQTVSEIVIAPQERSPREQLEMDPATRDYFDQQLDRVLADMPEAVHRLLDEVAMYVEDYPSREVMQRMNIRHRRQLCGLYTGIPLGSRSVEHSGILSDAVHIYREGIMSLAMTRSGQLDPDELRRQIRITVLHELGHHHGMSEDELYELGY